MWLSVVVFLLTVDYLILPRAVCKVDMCLCLCLCEREGAGEKEGEGEHTGAFWLAVQSELPIG